MQPPTTSNPHGYSDNRYGSSTSVKSHFLLPIPGWAVKTYHYTRHAEHYSTTDPPRGRIRRVTYPEIPRTRPYPFPVDPPRPVLDPTSTNRRSTRKQGPHATGSGGFSLSHPLRHLVFGDDRPFSEHVATTASTALNKTSLLRHPLVSLPPLDPIKGQAGDSMKGGWKKQKPSHHPTVEDQHLKQSPLYSHLFSPRPGIGSLSHSL
jgi:hypothetical protein